MLSQARDLDFGKKSEMMLHSKIEKLVGDSLNMEDGMSFFDYSNNAKTIYAELKTRRIKHNDFSTALIGKNKIDFCNKPGVDYYFVYSYTDGVFYIKYNKELFDTFEVDEGFRRSARTDCNNSCQPVVLIPTDRLIRYDCKKD